MPTPPPTLQAVLFDWDGTLLDSFDADSSAYLAMFHELGIPWGLNELAMHYTPNWHRVYRAARIPRSKWDIADKLWAKHYAHQTSKLVPSARSILTWIARRYQLGLVTSGDRVRVLRQLHYFSLTRLFATRVCAGDTRQKKPHPAPLRLALKQMCLDPKACVYVGDSPHDLEMSKRAGVRAIAVIGRFPTEAGLRAAKPEFLLNSLKELPAVLKSLEEQSRKSCKSSRG
jgi:HAD superfamily hydrolase (TIGR01509 family)